MCIPVGTPSAPTSSPPLRGCSVPEGIVALFFGDGMPTALMVPMGSLPRLCPPPKMMQPPPDAWVFWDRAVCLAFTMGFCFSVSPGDWLN